MGAKVKVKAKSKAQRPRLGVARWASLSAVMSMSMSMSMLMLMSGCGAASGQSEGDKAIDVTRADGGAAAGPCVDPLLAMMGASTVGGSTPQGEFKAAGARAFGRCLWLQFVSVRTVEGRACQKETITAATGLRVPPWFEGSRLPVGISLTVGDDMTSPLVASATLSIDTVADAEGAPILKGSLLAQQPGWTLSGTFEAPWTDVACK